MAAATVTRIAQRGVNAHMVGWSVTSADATGDRVEFPGARYHSVQVSGDFGVGGQIAWEGSNDGTNFQTLRNPQGNAISAVQVGLQEVQEHVRFCRPRVTGGTAVSLSVTALFQCERI